MADVTDAMFVGYIASFPTTYVRKVGRTSDEMYKTCFSAYMSSEHFCIVHSLTCHVPRIWDGLLCESWYHGFPCICSWREFFQGFDWRLFNGCDASSLHTGILLGCMAIATTVQRFRSGASTFHDRLRGAQEQDSGSMFRVRPILSQKFARKSVSTQQCGAHNVACQKL